jgi:hypothetical protein
MLVVEGVLDSLLRSFADALRDDLLSVWLDCEREEFRRNRERLYSVFGVMPASGVSGQR